MICTATLYRHSYVPFQLFNGARNLLPSLLADQGHSPWSWQQLWLIAIPSIEHVKTNVSLETIRLSIVPAATWTEVWNWRIAILGCNLLYVSTGPCIFLAMANDTVMQHDTVLCGAVKTILLLYYQLCIIDIIFMQMHQWLFENKEESDYADKCPTTRTIELMPKKGTRPCLECRLISHF